MSNFIIKAKKSGVIVYYGTRHGKQTVLGSLQEWLDDLSQGNCFYSEKRAKELVVLLESHYKDQAHISDITIEKVMG